MEITITVMSRAILNCNAISVRSDTRAYLRSAPSWKRIISHRIASLLFPRINECHSFLVVGGRNGSGRAASLFSRRGRRRAVGEGGGVANQWPFCLANRRDIRSTMRDIQAACSGDTLFSFFGVLPAYGNAVIT